VQSCLLGGEVTPGLKFSDNPSILLNNREFSPLGAKFTSGGEFYPWRAEVKLRMALWE
jgi:hypothetical protein